jgi:hypothetical protein
MKKYAFDLFFDDMYKMFAIVILIVLFFINIPSFVETSEKTHESYSCVISTVNLVDDKLSCTLYK